MLRVPSPHSSMAARPHHNPLTTHLPLCTAGTRGFGADAAVIDGRGGGALLQAGAVSSRGMRQEDKLGWAQGRQVQGSCTGQKHCEHRGVFSEHCPLRPTFQSSLPGW